MIYEYDFAGVRLTAEPENGLAAIGLQPLEFNAAEGNGYTVLPRMHGVLIPARSEDTPRGGHYEDVIFERNAYMTMFGQVTDTADYGRGWGYAAIFDTPYDARYKFDHDPSGDTVITPLFGASLGRIGDCELIRHELVNGDAKHQISVFAGHDGDITVEADFRTEKTVITVTGM